jgi:drug/metabolite transporter (DMT)-like permease
MRLPFPLTASLLVVFWSSGFVGATWATESAPFATALAWRTAMTALLLGAVALARRQRIPRAELGRQVVLGLLVQVVYLGGVFAAAGAGVPAGTTALIAALQPLLVAAAAGPMLGQPPTRRQVCGLLLGAAGVALVVAGDLGSSAPAAAFLLPVLAVLGLAGGTLLEGKWRPQVPLVASLALQSCVSAVVFAVASGVQGDLVPPATAHFAMAITWLVLLSACGGYGTYLYIVRHHGPTLASTLLYLTPPATAAWAWAMFGQVPGPLAVPGIAVCVAGVALFAAGRRGDRGRGAGLGAGQVTARSPRAYSGRCHSPDPSTAASVSNASQTCVKVR